MIPPAPPIPPAPRPAHPAPSGNTLAAEQLFNGRKEIVIEYRGESWRLRITRNDKLILTK